MIKAWMLTQKENTVFYFAILVSLLFSYFVGRQIEVLNPDGICYLTSAEVIGTNGLKAAMQVCGQAQWPFYSLLIYYFSKLGHVNYFTAAYTLNCLFSLISVGFFVLIVKELGAKRLELWFAAIVILLAHELLNVRSFIIRDHGFWAFYLVSIFFAQKYFTTKKTYFSQGWTISIVLAGLFRIEGIIFLLLFPFFTLLFPGLSIREKLKSFLQLNLLSVTLGLLLLFYFVLHPDATYAKLSRLPEIYLKTKQIAVAAHFRFLTLKNILIQNVITESGYRDAGLIVVLTILFWYFINLIKNVSFLYTFLIAYAVTKKLVPTNKKHHIYILSTYLFLSVSITIAFLAGHFFLSKRYLVATSLVLMVAIPFALADIFKKAIKKRSYFILFFAISAIFANSAISNIFSFGPSKFYLYEAGIWAKQNIPKSAHFYSNAYRILYYSAHFDHEIFHTYLNYQGQNLTDNRWKNYDYLALRVYRKKEDQASLLVKALPLTPIATFSNNHGDKVFIYKTSPETPRG